MFVLSSLAHEPMGASPPREDVISAADPVRNDNTVNNADNHNETDYDISDQEDENEEQLHATSDTDDIFVAAAGTSLTLCYLATHMWVDKYQPSYFAHIFRAE